MRKLREYITETHDTWLEDGFEHHVEVNGMDWFSTWRWYGCKVLRSTGLVGVYNAD